MADAILGHCFHIVSRDIARTVGLKHYFTGKPCARGHCAIRSVKRRACVCCEQQYRDERKEVIAEYKRAYHQKNKEKLCLASQAWYAANKERAAAYSRDHYLANRDRYRQWHASWSELNADRRRATEKAWREANSQRLKENTKKWKRDNHFKVLAYNRNRRALARGAAGSHTAEDILRIHRMQKGRCGHCRILLRGSYHVDHIVPLKNGGSNYPDNLQILCPGCNMSKGAKDPIQWKQEGGMLI